LDFDFHCGTKFVRVLAWCSSNNSSFSDTQLV
jgi:hypothetical protein